MCDADLIGEPSDNLPQPADKRTAREVLAEVSIPDRDPSCVDGRSHIALSGCCVICGTDVGRT